jgi:hypothetical protein
VAAHLSTPPGQRVLAAGALEHPIFAPYRPALERVLAARGLPGPEQLNAIAAALGIAPRTAGGAPVRFVAPEATAAGYELHIHETGRVPTRPESLHDLFNALVWLAFPRLKAQLNARHAAEIPRECGRRGRLRDLLTLLDEGGALVACADPELAALVQAHRWRELFAERRARVLRGLNIVVIGHAVLEQALVPWPGITCKAVFVDMTHEQVAAPANALLHTLDARGAQWLAKLPDTATPREVPPLPVFGFPGWWPDNDDPAFYADERYFRPLRRAAPSRENASGERAAR